MTSTQQSSEFILNWPPLHKCLLILALSALIQTSWLVWKLYIYYHPELWIYINIDYLTRYIFINKIILAVLTLPMLLCWYLRDSDTAQLILPYVCISTYSFTMIHEAYLVGLMSPATATTAVMSVVVGLVLFKRRIIYSVLSIFFAIAAWILYATLHGTLQYAPLFVNIAADGSSKAVVFWASAMLAFGLPILIGGLVLLELLLSQWRQREKNIEILSQIDPLTGLYNRRTLYHFLSDLLNKNNDKPSLHSLILLDLDFFKKINDSYGHVVGDKILLATAEALQNTVRHNDIVSRFGGEEFVIVLTNTTHEQTMQVAERCRNELMKITICTDSDELQQVKITASFGITHFDSDIDSTDIIFKQADEALYHAKDLGRNQVVHYLDCPQYQI